jgi:hypothetical protein
MLDTWRWIALGTLGVAAACGGKVGVSERGEAGGAGAGGASNAGEGGSPSGGQAGGLLGGQGGWVQGGQGGAAGCVDQYCGPDHAPCCMTGVSCANITAGTTCGCGDDKLWHCFGAGGSGGACEGTPCGPDWAPCCEPGLGCAAGNDLWCECGYDLTWYCSGVGGAGGSGPCDGESCQYPLQCCGATCVNPLNDPFSCGACGAACAYPVGGSPYCSYGVCSLPPCVGEVPCPAGTSCCGTSCCAQGQLCCDVQGPGPSGGPSCHWPTAEEPTCPLGCPMCQ